VFHQLHIQIVELITIQLVNPMTYRKLKSGTLYGQKGRYRAWIYKRPHGGYCAHLNYGGECIAREGYHGTSLPTIGKAKNYIKIKISKDDKAGSNCRNEIRAKGNA